jgi:hypothetical protein
MALIAEEISKGDRRQTSTDCGGRERNPFQWETVKLNLPGYKGYDPCVSWITKRCKDG